MTTATEEFKTNLVRAADDGGYRVRTQLAMAKQQMAVRDEPAPRGSLAARTARPHTRASRPRAVLRTPWSWCSRGLISRPRSMP